MTGITFKSLLVATPILCLAAALVFLTISISRATGQGIIAFLGKPTSTNDTEIFVVDADGRNLRQLTDNTTDETALSWSPTGRLAFLSHEFGSYGIYLINADGTDFHRLPNPDAMHGRPKWSPDGRQLVYYVIDATGGSDIFVMRADGSVLRLTDDPVPDSDPVWSPDGRQIAYVSQQEQDDLEIYTVNPDGTDRQRLTDNDYTDYVINWSPDSRRIAFQSWRTDQSKIYLMNADGTDVRQLTFGDTGEIIVGWSPDGQQLAYTSRSGDIEQLYIMDMSCVNVPESCQTDARPLPANVSGFAWSPDGSANAHTVWENWDHIDLYVTDRYGNTHPLTQGGVNMLPEWWP